MHPLKVPPVFAANLSALPHLNRLCQPSNHLFNPLSPNQDGTILLDEPLQTTVDHIEWHRSLPPEAKP